MQSYIQHASNMLSAAFLLKLSKTHYIYTLLLWRGLSFKSLLQLSVAVVLLCCETVQTPSQSTLALELSCTRTSLSFSLLTVCSLVCLFLLLWLVCLGAAPQGSGAWSRVPLWVIFKFSLYLTTLLSVSH